MPLVELAIAFASGALLGSGSAVILLRGRTRAEVDEWTDKHYTPATRKSAPRAYTTLTQRERTTQL